MPLEAWLAVVAASLVLLIIPGPTILTVIGLQPQPTTTSLIWMTGARSV
jgi:threonine/homoserine/homoserine lactone efflux protein